MYVELNIGSPRGTIDLIVYVEAKTHRNAWAVRATLVEGKKTSRRRAEGSTPIASLSIGGHFAIDGLGKAIPQMMLNTSES